MEPMETDDAPIVISTADSLERAPVTSAELPMDVDSASVLCKSDTSKEMEANNIDAQTGGGEGGACTAAMNAVSGEIDAPDVTEKLHGGVTAGPPEPAFSPPGQLGVPALTKRFAKMATGVADGPKPSGDGKALKPLNLQDLKDLNVTVLSFHVTTNSAVTEACPNLDERESRGFLAADLHGVELLPGCAAPTEGHKIGQRIEELLHDAKAADERLRNANKTRKSKARGKGLEPSELEAKLAASDAKFNADRSSLWSTVVELPMPSAPIEVKRERPPPTPKPPPPCTTAADVEKADAAVERAEADVVAAGRRMERAQAAADVLRGTLLATTGRVAWELDDDAYEKHKAVQDELDRRWKEAGEKAHQLSLEYGEARLAALDARTAADEVRHDLAAQKAAAQREAAAREQMELWRLEREREAAEAAAAAAAAEARIQEAEDAELEQLKQCLRKERAQFEFEMRESRREVARSQWYWSRNEVVQQHAREVWGAGWEQKNAENHPPAKVFSFVGKSADEVRSLASNVSQEVTGAEERVQLNRIQHEMLR